MPKSFEEPCRSGNFDWITNFAIIKRPIDITTEIIAKIIFSSTINFDYFFSISSIKTGQETCSRIFLETLPNVISLLIPLSFLLFAITIKSIF